jgi:hypothetical protein
MNNSDIIYQNHLKLKDLIRNDRNIDRNNKNKLVISFDLQKVITIPQSSVNNFYYKRKINVYNLTASESLSKSGYCAVWDEKTCGRTGSDIASALVAILNEILSKYNSIENLTLWSDSCIGQNKNSLITYALTHLIKNYPNLKEVILKFSVPGHGCVQEVDNIHSLIEKSFRNEEIFSLEKVCDLIKNAKRKNPLTVIELKKDDFKDYQTCAKLFNYKSIPFTKIFQLKITQNLFEIEFRSSPDSNFITANIRNYERSSKMNVNIEKIDFPDP